MSNTMSLLAIVSSFSQCYFSCTATQRLHVDGVVLGRVAQPRGNTGGKFL